MSALRVEDLNAWYGQAQVLRNVSLHVEPGEVVGLLGRNGAGKTTLLKAVSGLHRQQRSRVWLGEKEVTGLATHEIAKLQVSVVREGGKMPLSMTVAENIELGIRLSRLRGAASRTVEETLDAFPLLQSLHKRPAGVLSGGQRQTLSLAVAYASRPELLLLDEPSAGLSPQTARGVFDIIASLVAAGDLAALVVEQNAMWLEGLSSRNYVLEVGQIIDEVRSLETLRS
jgi:branched-chain amino acid transport system ATP-binding protein